MKFILIWLAISGSGAITSGSAQFEDETACKRAGAALVVNADGMRGKDYEGIQLIFECEAARSSH